MSIPSQDASQHCLRVFLCHSSGDKPIVRALYHRLKACNVNPWLDEEELVGGQDWDLEIQKAVRKCDAVLICLSREFLVKEGYGQKEIKIVLDTALEKPEEANYLIPLKLENCELPERLKRFQAINYFEGNSFDRLIKALKYRSKYKSETLHIEIALINCQASVQQEPLSLPDKSPFPLETRTQPGQSPQLIISTSSQKPYPLKKRISRRTVTVGLVGTAIVVGSGVGALVWNHVLNNPSGAQNHTPSLGKVLYTYHGHTSDIRALAWSPNGKYIATASNDYTAQVLDALTGRHIVTYQGHTYFVEGVAWSPDSTRVVTGSADGTVQIWKATTGDHLYTYRGHINTYQQNPSAQHHPWVNRVSWSPDGTRIASGDQFSVPGHIATVQVWEAATGKTLLIYKGHTDGVFSTAWSPQGKHIASCGYDGTLQIWDADTGNLIVGYGTRIPLYGLSWTFDSKSIAFGGNSTYIWVVTDYTYHFAHSYKLDGSNVVTDVAWSPDATHIVAGGKDTIHIFNVADGKLIYAYQHQSGSINALGWSPDNKYIASGSDDGTVQVWEAI
jgi:WD40 repeat protein